MTVHSVVHDFTGFIADLDRSHPLGPVDIQGRLRDIASGIPGRLSLTITSDEGVYVTHWLPPGPTGFGDCRTVCPMTADVEDALDAAREYVEAWR